MNAPPITQREIFRRAKPHERVRAGCALHDFAVNLVLLNLRRRHPDWSEREILLQAAKRFLGDAARVL